MLIVLLIVGSLLRRGLFRVRAGKWGEVKGKRGAWRERSRAPPIFHFSCFSPSFPRVFRLPPLKEPLWGESILGKSTSKFCRKHSLSHPGK